MRIKAFLSLIIITAAFCSKAAVCKESTFTDPSSGVSFSIPDGMKMKGDVYSPLAAKFTDAEGASVEVGVRKKRGRDLYEHLMSVMRGAVPATADMRAIGGREVLVGVRETGTVFLVPIDELVVEVVCFGGKGVKQFLACRRLAASIKAGKVNDLSAVKAVAERAMFALLDGRMSCDGISEEAQRMANIAGQMNDEGQTARLETLVSLLDGRAEGPAPAGALSRDAMEFFKGLNSAQEHLDSGGTTSAKRLLKRRAGVDSLRALSLKVRIDAIEAGGREIAAIFRTVEKRLCGRIGAETAHAFGTMAETESPELAEKFYRRAAEYDVSYRPARLALARLMLDQGYGAKLVAARLKLAYLPDGSAY